MSSWQTTAFVLMPIFLASENLSIWDQLLRATNNNKSLGYGRTQSHMQTNREFFQHAMQ